MHLKPPRILVSKVTRYEGPCLEKCTPAQEHKETMKSDEIKVRRTASASGFIFISIQCRAFQEPEVIKSTFTTANGW